jgi:hypothetical protein
VRKACPLAQVNQTACEAKGCCWAPTGYDPKGTACPNGSGIPACFHPNPPVKGTRAALSLSSSLSFSSSFSSSLFLTQSFRLDAQGTA